MFCLRQVGSGVLARLASSLIVLVFIVAYGCGGNTPSGPNNPGTTAGRILFSDNQSGDWDIYSANADGSDVTRIGGTAGDDFHPALSPDGTRIVFYSLVDGPTSEIYIMNADGSNVTRLTNNTVDDYVGANGWSPDGTRILFESRRNSSGDLYTMKPDGSDVQQLTHIGVGYDGTWDPTSDRIAYDSAGVILVINSDGSGVTQVTSGQGSRDGRPAWSPDGSWLAFYSERDGNPEIYLIRPDGTGVQRLTNNPAEDATPSWSSDGTRLFFESDRSGNLDIYSMALDGSDVVDLTNDAADACCVEGIPAP